MSPKKNIANKCIKRCLIPLVIREVQIKMAIKYHYTGTKMAKIKEH